MDYETIIRTNFNNTTHTDFNKRNFLYTRALIRSIHNKDFILKTVNFYRDDTFKNCRDQAFAYNQMLQGTDIEILSASDKMFPRMQGGIYFACKFVLGKTVIYDTE